MKVRTHPPRLGKLPAARFANIVLGTWLFLSAFLWPHAQDQFNNTWICGALAVVFALVGRGAGRMLNAALAIWLFISSWLLPTLRDATAWNNTAVAIAMFVFSMMGAGGLQTPSAPQAPPTRA